MDPRNPLRLVRQRWWYLLVAVVLAVAVAAVLTMRAQPRYAAQVTFFVTTGQAAGEAHQGGLMTQRVRTYVDLLTSDRLASRIAGTAAGAGLSADQIQDRISASTEPDTLLLRATVTDSGRGRALRLAEGLATRFVELVQQVEAPPDGGRPSVRVEVIGGPRLDAAPVSPRPVRDLPLAGLLGLLLGAAGALLRGKADTSVRDGAGLRQVTAAALLGQIPYDADARAEPLIVGAAAFSARAEAMRQLRTNLRFVDAQQPARVIAVTSAVKGEGKSMVACNLAICLAEAGWRVLLVDADLRRPRVADYLGLEARVGLTDVLIGEAGLGDVLQPWGDKGLQVLPGGSLPPNPSELLGSKGMADLLDILRELADIVIVDTAPLLAVTDGVVVAVQTDGALLLTRQGSTTRAEAAAAASALRSVSVRLLGCVLTMAKLPRREMRQYAQYRATDPGAEPSYETGPARPPAPADGDGAQAAASAPTEEFTRVRR